MNRVFVSLFPLTFGESPSPFRGDQSLRFYLIHAQSSRHCFVLAFRESLFFLSRRSFAEVSLDSRPIFENADVKLIGEMLWDKLPGPRLKDTLGQASFTWMGRESRGTISRIVFSRGGGNALHLACQQNHKAVVEALLQHSKIEPNLRDSNGMTPIHYAAAEGHLEVLKTMVSESKVDLNVRVRSPPLNLRRFRRNANGLYWWWTGYVRLMEAMVEESTVDFSPQVTAENCTTCRNVRAFHLDTPLHLAVQMKRVSAVKELCANPRLLPNSVNWLGWTPLDLTTWNGGRRSLKDIKDLLLAVPKVRKWMDGMERQKRALQSGANALLVVSTLMAGLSFAGAIAPPSGILGDSVTPSAAPTTNAVSASPLDRFLWFNHLTFFFSLLAGVLSLLSFAGSLSTETFLLEQVRNLRLLVRWSTFMVLLAATCAGCAFLAAEEVYRGGTSPYSLHLTHFLPRLVGAVVLGIITFAWSSMFLLHLFQVVGARRVKDMIYKCNGDLSVLALAAAKLRRAMANNFNMLLVVASVGTVAACLWAFFKMSGAW